MFTPPRSMSHCRARFKPKAFTTPRRTGGSVAKMAGSVWGFMGVGSRLKVKQKQKQGHRQDQKQRSKAALTPNPSPAGRGERCAGRGALLRAFLAAVFIGGAWLLGLLLEIAVLWGRGCLGLLFRVGFGGCKRLVAWGGWRFLFCPLALICSINAQSCGWIR